MFDHIDIIIFFGLIILPIYYWLFRCTEAIAETKKEAKDISEHVHFRLDALDQKTNTRYVQRKRR